MKRIISILLILLLISLSVMAGEEKQQFDSEKYFNYLRAALIGLTLQIMFVLVLVSREDVNPILKSQIQETLIECEKILESLGFSLRKLGGSRLQSQG